MDKVTYRDKSLDLIKGIAIFLVVMQHTGSYINEGIHFIVKFDIPMFFIVSGYLGFKEKLNVKETLINKARYILLPFVVAILFASLLYGENVSIIMSQIDKKGYWFLQALFIFFFIYVLINKIIRKYWLSISILTVIELLLLAASKFAPDLIDNYIGISYLSRYLPCFFAGIYIKMCAKSICHLHPITGGALLTISTIAFTYNGTSNISFPLYVCGYLTGAIYFFYFFRNVINKIPNNIVEYFTMIGRNSLTIYIIHFYYIWKIPLYIDSFIVNILITIIVSFLIISISLITARILTFATPLKYILSK